ncbi:MAG: hypothetical protein KatS3mg030_553 [Saprospiraceae bacterium]|nr:MAG: hypothetical protein KatS3mg030_553 [Saprospiraceae bacterium]
MIRLCKRLGFSQIQEILYWIQTVLTLRVLFQYRQYNYNLFVLCKVR